MRNIILSVAPMQAGKPVEKQKLIEDIRGCQKEGAAICHLHARDLEGVLTEDTTLMEEIFDEVKKTTDILAQVSTGGVSNLSIEKRCLPLQYQKAESASLNGGSCNLGEAVYHNSLEEIRYCVKKVYEQGILPEIEVFEIGMIDTILQMLQTLPFRKPIIFNLVFGHPGIMPADVEHLIAFRSMVPRSKEILWGVTQYGRKDWTFLAAAAALGASLLRIGFEDSNYLSESTTAVQNYELVRKLKNICEEMGLLIASPEKVRKLYTII